MAYSVCLCYSMSLGLCIGIFELLTVKRSRIFYFISRTPGHLTIFTSVEVSCLICANYHLRKGRFGHSFYRLPVFVSSE